MQLVDHSKKKILARSGENNEIDRCIAKTKTSYYEAEATTEQQKGTIKKKKIAIEFSKQTKRMYKTN